MDTARGRRMRRDARGACMEHAPNGACAPGIAQNTTSFGLVVGKCRQQVFGGYIGISVDTAVDVAKESADIILLQKDLPL